MAGIRLDWKPNAVLDMALAQVTTGMTRAAKFCAADAKRRARGKRIKDSISYRVITDGRKITGYVILGGKNGYIARFHETGTSKMAARPFARPAVLENGAEITRLIAKG